MQVSSRSPDLECAHGGGEGVSLLLQLLKAKAKQMPKARSGIGRREEVELGGGQELRTYFLSVS